MLGRKTRFVLYGRLMMSMDSSGFVGAHGESSIVVRADKLVWALWGPGLYRRHSHC